MGLLDDLEFLKQQRKPNLLADVQQLQRPAEPYLRQQYPEVYGGLGGLLGMAPDEMAGSILDPNTARVRAGAEYGFPVGTATQVVPALNLMKPAVAAGARALGPTAVRMGEGYLQRQGLMPQLDVYHGSPHKFDRFDASKIGTGEGAQAYGHGLYLAESPDTAKYYQQLALHELKADPYNASVINRFMGKSATPAENSESLAAYALADANKAPFVYDPVLAMKNLRDKARELRIPNPLMDLLGINPTDPAINKAYFDAARKYIRDFSNKTDGTGAVSHLYKVDLPDEQIAKMLDWDKPMTESEMTLLYDKMQQSRLASFAKPFQDNFYSAMERGHKTPDGQDLFMELSKQLGGQKYVSEALRDMGIPGIKYLDATSRGAGKGTRNFVMFPGEEQSLTILERNGQQVMPSMVPESGGVKKGQPLFTAAPIGGIGLGAGMQDNEMPDAVRQYMANPTPGLLQDEDERKKLGGLLYR